MQIVARVYFCKIPNNTLWSMAALCFKIFFNIFCENERRNAISRIILESIITNKTYRIRCLNYKNNTVNSAHLFCIAQNRKCTVPLLQEPFISSYPNPNFVLTVVARKSQKWRQVNKSESSILTDFNCVLASTLQGALYKPRRSGGANSLTP